MRKIVLIRWGVATVLLGGAGGMLAAGCGSSSGGSTSNNNPDSGNDDSSISLGDDGSLVGDDGSVVTPTGDGGGSDAAVDGDAAVVVQPERGKLILVHAAGYAPPMRFCFGFVNGDAGRVTIAKVAAAPNTPLGLPPGLGGPAAESPTDIASQTIEVYGIAAAAIAAQTSDAGAAELTCDQMIGATALPPDGGGVALTLGADYWDLGQLPSGTIADGTTTLLAIVGCAPGQTSSTLAGDLCPAGYNASTGDLGLWYKALDRTTVADGGVIGAQFAYLSQPFNTETGGSLNLTSAAAGFYLTQLETIEAGTPEAGSDGGDAEAADAGPTQIAVTVPALPLVAAGVGYGSLTPGTVALVPGVSFDGTSGFFVNAVQSDGGTVAQVALPLPAIQSLSFPNSDAGAFKNGSNYTFVLVGDPRQPSFVGADGGATAAGAGTFNPLSVHILGFPNDPPFGN